MKIKLVKVIDEADVTKSFVWKSEKDIDFHPGQYFYFTLPKLDFPDPRGSTRQFTLSSSPSELPLIKFTTRIRKESGFKQTLNTYKTGDFIDIEGPNGSFIINSKLGNPQILIAGGIGITPFRSFIKYEEDINIGNNLFLIYSNSKETEITFRKELDLWKNKGLVEVAYTITEKIDSNWKGLTGRIDVDMLKKLFVNWKLDVSSCNYWISGPPLFVTAMENHLSSMKVSNSNINTDKFTGY